MKAIYYEKTGEPQSVLKLIDATIPEPEHQQVLLKMKLMPINPMDLATIRGVYRTPQKTPTVPGAEGVGEVIKIGSNVRTLSVGSSVLVLPFKNPGWTNGSWQEYLCLDETEVFPIPADIDPNLTPQFFNSILTAWVLIVNDLNLGPGQSLLMTAAGSSVGKLVLKLAAERKFSVIGVVRRPEQVEEIKKLGATDVICSATEDITKRVFAMTALKGVDAVMDAVGGEVSSQCFRAMNDWGQMIIYGLLELERNSQLDIRKMLFYNLGVRGFWLPGWWLRVDLETRTIAINKCFEMIRRGILIPEVEHTYSLQDINQAVAHAERPGNKGRIMLSPFA
jgi:NADPH:quinone reductase-like Zn-dependent oxidoreductase